MLSVYVELVRGTPLVLQLYLIFFVLPEIGPSLPPVIAAILGLAVNYSAYEAEMIARVWKRFPEAKWRPRCRWACCVPALCGSSCRRRCGSSSRR